jgi:hypothetical protein
MPAKGRRSGNEITVPVNYAREGDTLWILSLRGRTWWRNLKGGSTVGLRIHGRDVRGTAEVVANEPDVAAQLGGYVGQFPAAAGPLGLRLKYGALDPANASRIAAERLFVRVCVEESVR